MKGGEKAIFEMGTRSLLCWTVLFFATCATSQLAPCPRTDTACWSRLACKYTNQVRRRHGVGTSLVDGPKAMLRNAVNYAKELVAMGQLDHQDLYEAAKKVGCGRFICGENVAMVQDRGDIAKHCVDSWESSSGHLSNMVASQTEETSIGVQFDKKGSAYCVQTFSTVENSHKFGMGRCAPIKQPNSDKNMRHLHTSIFKPGHFKGHEKLHRGDENPDLKSDHKLGNKQDYWKDFDHDEHDFGPSHVHFNGKGHENDYDNGHEVGPKKKNKKHQFEKFEGGDGQVNQRGNNDGYEQWWLDYTFE